MSTPESNLLAAVCDYLSLRKHFFWRSNNSGVATKGTDGRLFFRKMAKHSMRGVPDIILIKDGFFVGLEVKPKGKYQSAEQKEFERACKEAGAEYYVIRSIDDLIEVGL